MLQNLPSFIWEKNWDMTKNSWRGSIQESWKFLLNLKKNYMATVHKDSGHETVYVKGACDYILERCTYVQKK